MTEIHIEIEPGDLMPSSKAAEGHDRLVGLINADGKIGEIVDTGSGGGVMDIFVEVPEDEVSDAIGEIRTLVQNCNIGSITTVEEVEISDEEVIENFNEGEFGEYFLASYGVESFTDILENEADTVRFIEELTFTEDDNPDASLLWHLEPNEIRVFLKMIARKHPEIFLGAAEDSDFPDIDPEIIEAAKTLAQEQLRSKNG